jgi:uncharacterized membrane protein
MPDKMPFPLPPAPFSGDSRTTDPGACFDWLRQGWALFSLAPGRWLGLALATCASLCLPAVVPWLGPALAFLLMPLLAGGFFAACQRAAAGTPPAFADLYRGFSRQGGALLRLGALGMLALLGVRLVLGLSGRVLAGQVGPGAALAGFSAQVGLTLFLLVPLGMAFSFAPALALLHGMPAGQALRASFAACARNALAFLVLALIFAILLFFALLPMGLGVLLLLPVLFGTLYAAYRDIFPGI